MMKSFEAFNQTLLESRETLSMSHEESTYNTHKHTHAYEFILCYFR